MSKNQTPPPAAVTATQIGLNEEPGHSLSGGQRYAHYGRYYEFLCGCGERFMAGLTAQLRADSRTLRRWREHLEAHSTPTDFAVHVGTVVKKRVTWRVLVVSRNYEHLDLYASGRYAQWIDPDVNAWWSAYHWAVVIDKGKSGKVISTVARSKKGALDKALELLGKAYDEGHFVEYKIDKDAPGVAPTVTAQTIVTDLLNRADLVETLPISDLDLVIQQIDDMLGYFSILKSKRDALMAVRHERTVGLLS